MVLRLVRSSSFILGTGVSMTTQTIAPTPRENNFRNLFRCFSLRGCRQISSSFTEKCSPKALQTTTSEVSLLLGQNKLGTHIVVVFWLVIRDPDQARGALITACSECRVVQRTVVAIRTDIHARNSLGWLRLGWLKIA